MAERRSVNASPLRLAVVGAGHMGKRHIKTCLGLPTCTLEAVVDAHLDQASLPAMLRTVADAVIIATPPNTHTAIAVPLLQAGIHCLVEKPLALSESEYRAMRDAAEKGGVVLAAGHCERFNPVIRELRKNLHGMLGLSIRRFAPPSPRSFDLDVTDDLLVHDLDWVLHHFKEEVETISVSHARFQESRLVEVDCHFSFNKGLDLRIQASMDAENRERTATLLGPSPKSFDLDVIPQPDALTLQLASFIDAVAGRPSPIATAREAENIAGITTQVKQQCLDMAVQPFAKRA